MPQLFADKVVNVRLCDTVISAAAVNYIIPFIVEREIKGVYS